MKGNTPWLLALGSAVVTAFGGLIAWGQLRAIRVPQDHEWAHVAPICPDAGVDAATLGAAVALLLEHRLEVQAEPGPCDARAAIHVRVSPTDVERLWPSTEGLGEQGEMTGSTAAEAFERRVSGALVLDATVYLRRGTDETALVHGLLHALGYDHPRLAPVGHVLSPRYDRIGLEDWRGIP